LTYYHFYGSIFFCTKEFWDMSPTREVLPVQVQDERLQAVAGWIQDNYKPALRVITEGEQLTNEEPQQEFEVREYQLEAWTNVWDARQEGKTRGLIHLATGLGKTSVAVFDVMKYREECAAQDPPIIPRILFVSHMNDISEQAHERFNHFMPDAETTYFKTRQKDLPDADITFATFQSLHSELDRFDPQDFEYIIYDEAHHSEADTFKVVREHFDPLFELALTATPDRMDQQNIREYFGEPLYKKTLPEAIAEGWLADVDYHIVFDDIVKQLMEEGFEPKTIKEFHELFKVRPRNEVIAKNIREERHKIGLDAAKTIVFCEGVTHAEEMAELLGGVAYHSEVEKDDRKEILKDFRAGNQQVICTVDMFNEGIDIPDARLIVFLRSTQSGTIFEQQLGRGLRKTAGKEMVSVLDFVANIERIQKVRELSKGIRNANGGGEGGDADPTIIDLVSGDNDDKDGIQIHTSHGDFDFDRIAVDLLGKFANLQRPTSNIPGEPLIASAQLLWPGQKPSKREIDKANKEGSFPASAHIVKEVFGSISNFQNALGYETRDKNAFSKYTNEELLDLARSLWPGTKPSAEMISKASSEGAFGGMMLIKSRFGRLTEFQQALGHEASYRLKFSDMSTDDLVKTAQSLWSTRPTYREMVAARKAGRFPSGNFLKKRFGSMEAFFEATGFSGIQEDTSS
jgi:superfamily II DNA or RNA helicase